MREKVLGMGFASCLLGLAVPCLANDINAAGNIAAEGQLVSTVGTGTAPLAVSSTTMVTNLNAELLGGSGASSFATSSHAHGSPTVGLVDGPHRRFVSSAGDDTNPCTLGSPCRSFAAAVAATDAGGEVVVLDSGDYGPMTIAKALTVLAPPGVYAGIAVSSGAGVTVNVAASDVVVLRGLTIHGTGGEDGIIFNSGAGTLHVEDCAISDFTSGSGDGNQGIDANVGRLIVNDTRIKNAGAAVRISSEGYFDRVHFENNQQIGLFLVEGVATIRDSVVTGSPTGIAGDTCCGGTAQLMVENCLVTHNATGIRGDGVDSAVRVANSVIVNNSAFGLQQSNSASLLSRGDNTVEGNATDTDGTIGSYSPQ